MLTIPLTLINLLSQGSRRLVVKEVVSIALPCGWLHVNPFQWKNVYLGCYSLLLEAEPPMIIFFIISNNYSHFTLNPKTTLTNVPRAYPTCTSSLQLEYITDNQSRSRSLHTLYSIPGSPLGEKAVLAYTLNRFMLQFWKRTANSRPKATKLT